MFIRVHLNINGYVFEFGLHGFSHADVVPAGPAGQGMAGKNQ